jgi:uncharacterized protein YdeI (YjbR/CyaY-like superfamily)
MNPAVDFYFIKAKKWQDEYLRLRDIVLSCGLDEELKWGCPCYTADDRNVVLIHGFKDYCALLFFKGALMKDQKGILIQQSKNVQAARQMRFTSIEEITTLEPTIKAYVKDAIRIEKSGVMVAFKKVAEYEMPDEFNRVLSENKSLKKAFSALTPGRQRGYLLYFGSAKQLKTREDRIEKYIGHILKGKGLDDK